MSNKRSKSGNGAPTILPNLPPPLNQEEWAEIVGMFKKRGLPVILYVFQGPDSINASRIQEVNYRQMMAVATELDEWSRGIFRNQIAQAQAGASKIVRGIALPEGFNPNDLKGQGQG